MTRQVTRVHDDLAVTRWQTTHNMWGYSQEQYSTDFQILAPDPRTDVVTQCLATSYAGKYAPGTEKCLDGNRMWPGREHTGI